MIIGELVRVANKAALRSRVLAGGGLGRAAGRVGAGQRRCRRSEPATGGEGAAQDAATARAASVWWWRRWARMRVGVLGPQAPQQRWGAARLPRNERNDVGPAQVSTVSVERLLAEADSTAQRAGMGALGRNRS